MIYLATPYIHTDKKVCNARQLAVTKAAAHFMDQGKVIYSPITHGGAIHPYMNQEAGDHRFWLDQCYFYVTHSTAIYVLGIDGWTESTGVRWEVETAFAWKIPVFLVNPNTYELKEILKDEWGYCE